MFWGKGTNLKSKEKYYTGNNKGKQDSAPEYGFFFFFSFTQKYFAHIHMNACGVFEKEDWVNVSNMFCRCA